MSSANTYLEESWYSSDPSNHCDSHSNILNGSTNTLSNNPTYLSTPTPSSNGMGLTFTSKGLHFCNLNIQHILPKINELRFIVANDKCPDILGLCETFLAPNIMDSQVAIDGYDFIRKHRADTQDKTGGGIILYFRNSLKCKRRPELKISKIETIWSEIELPNAKHFLVCLFSVPSIKCA